MVGFGVIVVYRPQHRILKTGVSEEILPEILISQKLSHKYRTNKDSEQVMDKMEFNRESAKQIITLLLEQGRLALADATPAHAADLTGLAWTRNSKVDRRASLLSNSVFQSYYERGGGLEGGSLFQWSRGVGPSDDANMCGIEVAGPTHDYHEGLLLLTQEGDPVKNDVEEEEEAGNLERQDLRMSHAAAVARLTTSCLIHAKLMSRDACLCDHATRIDFDVRAMQRPGMDENSRARDDGDLQAQGHQCINGGGGVAAAGGWVKSVGLLIPGLSPAARGRGPQSEGMPSPAK